MHSFPGFTPRADKLSPVRAQAHDPRIQGRSMIYRWWRHSRLCDYPLRISRCEIAVPAASMPSGIFDPFAKPLTEYKDRKVKSVCFHPAICNYALMFNVYDLFLNLLACSPVSLFKISGNQEIRGLIPEAFH
ncbi:hypothetical protein KKF97_20650 [Myxococcota bacterium]|nr:hypothetical protein [Myxococcota bacterium]